MAQPTQLAHIVSDRLFRKTGTRYAPEVIQIILDQRDRVLHSEETSDRIRGMNPTRYDPKLGRHVELTDEEQDIV